MLVCMRSFLKMNITIIFMKLNKDKKYKLVIRILFYEKFGEKLIMISLKRQK